VGSLVEMVLSLNVSRRHLTTGQRAVMGERSLPHFEVEAQARQIAAGTRGAEGGRGNAKPLASIDAKGLGGEEREGKSANRAGKAVGIGETTVNRVKHLHHTAPDLYARFQ